MWYELLLEGDVLFVCFFDLCLYCGVVIKVFVLVGMCYWIVCESLSVIGICIFVWVGIVIVLVLCSVIDDMFCEFGLFEGLLVLLEMEFVMMYDVWMLVVVEFVVMILNEMVVCVGVGMCNWV